MKIEPKHLKIAAAVLGGLFLLFLVVSCSRPSYPPSGYGTVVPTPTGPAIVQEGPVYQQPVAAAPAVVAAPAPVIINQAPVAHHSSFGDSFMGSMAGTMLGNALSRPHVGPSYGGGDTTVHKNVTINKTYVQAAPTTTSPAPVPAPVAAPQSPVTKPAFTPPPPRLSAAPTPAPRTAFAPPAPRPSPVFSRPSPSPSFSRPSFSAPRRR